MSSSPDAMAESLNYPNMKRRAVASRSYRVKISPSNGQTFTDGQTVNVDMPSNLAGTYIKLESVLFEIQRKINWGC